MQNDRQENVSEWCCTVVVCCGDRDFRSTEKQNPSVIRINTLKMCSYVHLHVKLPGGVILRYCLVYHAIENQTANQNAE